MIWGGGVVGWMSSSDRLSPGLNEADMAEVYMVEASMGRRGKEGKI